MYPSAEVACRSCRVDVRASAPSLPFQMILYPWGYDYRVTPAPDTKELVS